MEVGQNGVISTLTYNAKSGVAIIFESAIPENYYSCESETNLVPCVLLQQIKEFMFNSTNAIAIGQVLQQPWREI